MEQELRLGRSGVFSAFALIFGILAILSFWTGICPIILAGLAFTFAFLSRGYYGMSGSAKAGVVCSIIALILTAALVTFIVLYYGESFFELPQIKPYKDQLDLMLGNSSGVVQQLDQLLQSQGIHVTVNLPK